MAADDKAMAALIQEFFLAISDRLDLLGSVENATKRFSGLTGWENWLKFEFYLFCRDKGIQVIPEKQFTSSLGKRYADLYLEKKYLEIKRKTHRAALFNGIRKDALKYEGINESVYFLGICREPVKNETIPGLRMVKSDDIGTAGYNWVLLKKA